jgi:hypothetical protein
MSEEKTGFNTTNATYRGCLWLIDIKSVGSIIYDFKSNGHKPTDYTFLARSVIYENVLTLLFYCSCLLCCHSFCDSMWFDWTKHITTDVWNPGPGLGQAQTCGRVKPVNEIPTFPP